MTQLELLAARLRREARREKENKARTIKRAKKNRATRVAAHGPELRMADVSLMQMYKSTGFTYKEISTMMGVPVGTVVYSINQKVYRYAGK